MLRLFRSGRKDQPTSATENTVSHAPSHRSERIPQNRPTTEGLEKRIIGAIQTVYDPEIPVNVYDLGLIYNIEIGSGGKITIRMTLTAPACPVAGSLPAAVAEAVRRVPGVSTASVDLVFDPPWSNDRMSEEAKLQLGLG